MKKHQIFPRSKWNWWCDGLDRSNLLQLFSSRHSDLYLFFMCLKNLTSEVGMFSDKFCSRSIIPSMKASLDCSDDDDDAPIFCRGFFTCPHVVRRLFFTNISWRLWPPSLPFISPRTSYGQIQSNSCLIHHLNPTQSFYLPRLSWSDEERTTLDIKLLVRQLSKYFWAPVTGGALYSVAVSLTQ